jgi:lactosylceramide 4-alpha-galactosyltransferase
VICSSYFLLDFESETNNTAIITNERLPKLNKALSIFFIETSGRSCLTARQACGIESAARANPKAIITLYMEKNPIVNLSKIDSDRRKIDCSITSALLKQFENVRVVREDLLGYLEGTPFWEFYRTGPFNKSTTPLVHRSDVIRVALLWKNGGVYLDFDCIVMRSLDDLNNTVGTVRDFIPNWVENGVMAFTAGHPFLHFLMKSMVLGFRWDNYLSLGPPALTEAILEFCHRNDLPANKWLHCWRNSSMFIQPADSFYAIGSGRADAFYQPEANPADWDKLKNSFLSHIYDSGSERIVPSDSLYARLARKYCPVSYRMTTEEENGQL